MDKDKKHRNYSNRNLYNLPLFGYRLLIFFIQIFILFACITFAQIIYNNNILPDKRVKESFTETTCTIVSKKLSSKGRVLPRYRADFLVSYNVADNPYQTWVTGNGLDQAFFHKREPQEATLEQFTVGTSYPCWYNPQIPQIAVLVLRHNWASTLPLAVPTIIGLIAIYYMLKSIFQFFGLLAAAAKRTDRFKK